MRFCGNCGSRLRDEHINPSNRIPEVNTAAPAPEQLGVMMGADLLERLKSAGFEAAGQRRNVSVLFADMTGYTALTESMDGEDIFEIIQQYIRLLINNVYKYEGIVDKLTGDGLMALFGAPIAHENNAERAVRSALDMQADVLNLSRSLKKQLGIEINMHIGLHSGSVIVGGIGSNLLMDYTAIGDTVNLARRIEEAAPPGTILVSQSVYQQTKALFNYRQVSILNPKGIAHPVQAFSVTGRQTRPGSVRGIEGLRAPMIGRDAELALLKEAVASLISRKQGQFVMISGEAGLGKSRLTAEFLASLDQYPLNVVEGQGLAYRRSISYWMFLEVIYSYLGLSASTPQLQIRERLVRYAYLALGSQASEILPFFEHLLSLPYSDPSAAERMRYLDAGQLRQQIFLAIRDLLLVESYRKPILLILDDLHWADDASLELLQFLVPTLRQAPIFIIAISRNILPGTMSKIVELAESQLGERFKSLELQNLSRDQSEQLLHQLITITSLSEELREQILMRSAGIPFYMEEILRMLIDGGAIQRQNNHWQILPEAEILNLRVPDTLQGLILARFDRLEPDQRRVLQVASVIGKNFSLPVLIAVINRNAQIPVEVVIDSLLEREFILPKKNDLEEEYTFRHILMSDAIYGTLLRRDRSILHGQVGKAIEEIYSDRLESQIELLANHYRWSPQLDQALHYLILAGQKARRNNIHEQARQHFETALELLPKVDHQAKEEIDVQLGLGDELVFFGDYPSARQHYQEALQIAVGGEEDQFAKVCCALHRNIAKTHERQGDYDQALVHLKEGLDALSRSSYSLPVEQAQIWNDTGWIHFRRGNFSEAQELLKKALKLVESSDAYDAIASIYNRLGGLAYNQGDWDQAASYLRKSIAMRESIGDVLGLATSFNNLGLLEIEMGEFSNALANLTRSYELKTRLGQSEGIAMTLNNLGWLRIDRGELEEAEKALNEALEMARQIGYASLLRLILKNFGKLYLASQEWEKARQVLCETTQALKELGSDDQLVDTYRLLGEAALGSGDLEAAADWSQKARDLVNQFEDKNEKFSAVQRGELWLFWGMLATRTGEYEQARKHLKTSSEVFQNLKSRLYQGKVAYQFGELSKAQQDRTGAQLHYREAALLFQSVGAKLEEKRANEARLRA